MNALSPATEKRVFEACTEAQISNLNRSIDKVVIRRVAKYLPPKGIRCLAMPTLVCAGLTLVLCHHAASTETCDCMPLLQQMAREQGERADVPASL